ncbi:MAG TPA: hypothetical protein VFX24_09220 [Ktedonobacterales bacterium]|nr:hypothetical protein [Ktedonobacterales bacterium]
MSSREKPSPEERAAMWVSVEVDERIYRDADEKRISRGAFNLYILICVTRAVDRDEAHDPDTVAELLAWRMSRTVKTTRRYIQELVDLGYDVTWGGQPHE